jgi:membrane protease YdiL (CAAX protease family)
MSAPLDASDAPRTSRPSTHPDATTRGSIVGFALGLAVVIVVAEYLARRVLAPALPTIGSPTVNDMLAAALCYGLLVALTATPAARSPATLGRTLMAVLARAGSWLPWVGGLLFLLAVMFLAFLDRLLWGAVVLPSFTAPPSGTVLVAGLATPLAIAALLVVNGVVIPLAEERLWRGLIQPRLFAAWGLLPAVLVTAVLFSLKHAVVDASLGRLVAIVVGGVVLGVVAHRAGGLDGGRNGWQTSAVSHMVANITATCIALAAGAL